MPGSKSPQVLTVPQREALERWADALTYEDIVTYYTLTPKDLRVIYQEAPGVSRLGMAAQLALLRYPGRIRGNLDELPEEITDYLAAQIDETANSLEDYAQHKRDAHLKRWRSIYDYRWYTGDVERTLLRDLFSFAMESDEALPLVELAMQLMRQRKIIVPGISRVEAFVWRLLRLAEYALYRQLTGGLTSEQCTKLEALLVSDGEQSQLNWLRQPVGTPSRNNLYRVLDQIAVIRDLDLPAPTAETHPNRIRKLARQTQRCSPYLLTTLSPRRRYASLVAHLGELECDLIDQTIDMFDAWMVDLQRTGRKRHQKAVHDTARISAPQIHQCIRAVKALLQAKDESVDDPYATVFAQVSEDVLRRTVEVAEAALQTTKQDPREQIESVYIHRRRVLLTLYRALDFRAVSGKDQPELDALDYVLRLDLVNKRVRGRENVINRQPTAAPVKHFSHSRLRHKIEQGVNGLNPNFYELVAFERLQASLRSGDVAVIGSRRYQGFEHYLMSPAEWREVKVAARTRLAITHSAQQYLADRQAHIENLLDLTETLILEEKLLSTDEDGGLHLERLKKAVPEEAVTWRNRLYSAIPPMQFSNLLLDVDRWTGFLSHFTHLRTGISPQGNRKKALVAALIALGQNLGFEQMALASEFTAERLSDMADWHIRDETLLKAMAELDNFVLHHPYSRNWGDGTRSASDGIRFTLDHAPFARHNSRYFGKKRGITVVAHVADVWMPFSLPVITNTSSEALYIIDALCHHESDLHIQEHYTDSAGAIYHVFALTALLGFQFAPNLRQPAKQWLYSVQDIAVHVSLAAAFKGAVRKDLIIEYWDDIQRLASSIGYGVCSAALIMRKLLSYPRQNKLAQALKEVGKLEHTLFVLRYLGDEVLQRSVRIGLNKSESMHSLFRALNLARSGILAEKRQEELSHRISCMALLAATISAWNTLYLDYVVNEFTAHGIIVPEDLLPHISPNHWAKINFLGEYRFSLDDARSLENLRPLVMDW
jgi:TnpA family transposase